MPDTSPTSWACVGCARNPTSSLRALIMEQFPCTVSYNRAEVIYIDDLTWRDMTLMQKKVHPVVTNYQDFSDLTSVHANCADTMFVASGYD